MNERNFRAKAQRKDGQYNRDENQIKDGIERVVNGLQDFVNPVPMLFFAPFAALRETDLSSYKKRGFWL